ncbi:MAG: long-chain-fatty-acid--CoA ligase [Frankiaceae bacterium]
MALSIASILAESAQRHPDKAAVIFADRPVSYATLWDQARRWATVMRERGVGPGDRVAILLGNTPHFPIAYYAVLALGGVVVPVHALLRAEEIEYALRDAEARLLICAGPLLGEGAKGAELAGVPVLAAMDGGDAAVERIDALAASAEPIAQLVMREPDDDAVILYTSGTTGQPKGAVLSQFNMVMNAVITATSVMEIADDDVVIGVLPLFHSFGQSCVMNSGFFRGATIVLMPRFDGAQALEQMIRHQVTLFVGVPTMYIGLLEAARNDDRRPPLVRGTSGGSSLPLTVIERFKEVFGVDIFEGYGLSETSPVATFNQKAYGRKVGTVGRAIWGVDVEIARAEIEERIELLPPGEIGEVVIRGHNVMKGYHNRPEATAAAIVDGWFRSGDLGVKDEDGFISIVDRKKDLVIRGGFNVYPREVEERLLRHPAIGQVAVIGLPHDVYGEEVCAVVVRSPEAADRDEGELGREIVDWAREQLGRHKYPRVVRFAAALPLGPSGKVLKRELVATYRDGAAESAGPPGGASVG